MIIEILLFLEDHAKIIIMSIIFLFIILLINLFWALKLDEKSASEKILITKIKNLEAEKSEIMLKKVFSENDISGIQDNIFNMYVKNKFIVPHGWGAYQKTYRNLMCPMETSGTFVSCTGGEFGSQTAYSKAHTGIDLLNYYSQSVFATSDAVVFNSYFDQASGWTIGLSVKYTENNKVTWLFIRYEHLETLYVKKGDIVKQNDVIGQMGNTGTMTTGTHLHYEIHEMLSKDNWVIKNPFINSTYENRYIKELL